MQTQAPAPEANILIVDDEPAVRMTLEMALADTPHHVTSVENAEAALAALRGRRFDLLIVDKNLPGINGVELIRRVRAFDEETLAAMITGYPSAESAMEMLHLGVSGYLEKPFEDIYEVVRRIDHLLATKSQGKRLKSAVERMRSAVQLMPAARSLRVMIAGGTADERTWLARRTGSGLDSTMGVANAQEALAQIKAQPPDLLVVDSSMRSPDLFTFIRSARELAPSLAFAILCDAPSLKMLTDLIDLRAAAVIQRPLSESAYRMRIDGVLGRLRLDDSQRSPPPASHAVPR